MSDQPQRRESDTVLAMMREQAKEDRYESRVFRTETREVHAEMLTKLECLPLLAAKLEDHHKWIEGDGKDAVKSISRAKWTLGALAIGGGAAGGSIIQKLLAALGITGGH